MNKKKNNNEVRTSLSGDLPEGWILSNLGEISSKPQYGWTTKANHESGNVKLLRTTDITSGQINWATVPYCSKEPDDLDKYLLKPGDIVISRAGSVGVSYLLTDTNNAVFASYLIRFRPNEPVDKKFVYYYLKSPDYWKAIGKSTLGIAVPNVNATKLAKVKIPIAPEKEQKRIVAEIEKQFSRLDEAVENLKRVKVNLKRYRASVLKAAVEGKLTEEWREKHPDVEPADKLLGRILAERRKKWEEAESVKMKAKGKVPKDDKWKKKYKEPSQFDESLLPDLPNGWAWAKLPQLGELNRGKSKHRPRNAPILYGGPYPFVQTGDVRHATGIIKQYTQTYSEEGLKQSRLWPKGTLCITIAANIADTAILGFNACFPDSIVGFIPENENIDVRFVEYFIRTAKEDLERYAPATAQKNINLSILSDVAVPLPPQEEQYIIIDEIAKCLTIAEGIEFDVEQNMRRTERLRQSILKKAFSGDLVKPIPGEEPATVLLERIQRQRGIEKDQKPTAKKGKRSMGAKETYLSLEEVDDDHLSKILAKNGVEIAPKSLWRESKLTIDDFYAQLKREVEGNLIVETSERLLKLIA